MQLQTRGRENLIYRTAMLTWSKLPHDLAHCDEFGELKLLPPSERVDALVCTCTCWFDASNTRRVASRESQRDMWLVGRLVSGCSLKRWPHSSSRRSSLDQRDHDTLPAPGPLHSAVSAHSTKSTIPTLPHRVTLRHRPLITQCFYTRVPAARIRQHLCPSIHPSLPLTAFVTL